MGIGERLGDDALVNAQCGMEAAFSRSQLGMFPPVTNAIFFAIGL